MSKSKLSLALVAAALSITVQAVAQEQATRSFHRTQCIKAEPGKAADLEKFALEVGHKGTMVRANAGEFSSALMLRNMLGGTEADCDFVAVTIYEGFPPDPDNAMKLDTLLEKAGVGMNAEEYRQRQTSLGRLVSTSLWTVQDGFGSAEKGDYIQVNFMKPHPGKEEEWLKMERETFKPAHQARAEKGFLRGWNVVTLAFPSGTSLPYSAATVDIMPNWKAVGDPGGGYAEAFQKLQPGADLNAIFMKVSATRDIVRSDLYRVIDTVRPMEKATRTKR